MRAPHHHAPTTAGAAVPLVVHTQGGCFARSPFAAALEPLLCSCMHGGAGGSCPSCTYEYPLPCFCMAVIPSKPPRCTHTH